MKKLYFIMVVLLFATTSNAQTTLAAQDFESAGSDTWSFTPTPAVYNTSGDVWDEVGSLGTIAAPQSGAIFWGMQDLNNGNGGGAFDHTLAFSNISVTGETNIVLSFYYYTDGYDSTDELRVEYFFNDVSQGVELLEKNTDAWTFYSKVVPDGTTDVRMTLIGFQNGGSDYAGFDNILLQSGAVTDPSLAISSPMEGETVNSGTAGFDAVLDVQNFTVSGDDGMGASDNTGDGFIKYSVDSGTSVNKFDTGAITLTGLASGAHTLFVELVDNMGNPLTTAVNATVNFMVNDIVQTLPLYEAFDYTVAENLGDQTIWTNLFSGDEVVVGSASLSYAGIVSSAGNHVMFDGSGQDPQLEFMPVTSGEVFSSFIFSVTDQSAITDVTDGGYFAILGDFDARLWVRPNPDATASTFDIGGGAVSSAPPVTTGTYNIGDSIFIVMSYNIDTNTVSVWVNPSNADLMSGTAPMATITDVDTADVTEISKFIIRQDSSGETPSILFDELRIGTSWADVTPTTLSDDEFTANSFSVYPNPTSTGFVNINSTNSSDINVAVYDILGKQVKNETLSNNRMDVSNLNTGVYILKITQNNASVTKKLVIRE